MAKIGFCDAVPARGAMNARCAAIIVLRNWWPKRDAIRTGWTNSKRSCGVPLPGLLWPIEENLARAPEVVDADHRVEIVMRPPIDQVPSDCEVGQQRQRTRTASTLEERIAKDQEGDAGA